MIGVVLKGHDFKYEVSELIKLFTSDFRFIDERDCMMVVENTVFFHNNNVFSKTMYCENYGVIYEHVEHRSLEGLCERENKKVIKETIKRSIFKILEKKFNITPPWGILTGIRPVKIVHSLLDNNSILFRVLNVFILILNSSLFSNKISCNSSSLSLYKI